jgi:hypothetical protein
MDKDHIAAVVELLAHAIVRAQRGKASDATVTALLAAKQAALADLYNRA